MAAKKKKSTSSEEESFKGLEFLKQSLAYIEIVLPEDILAFNEMPEIHQPQPLIEDPAVLEHVYPIYDFGNRLIASKATENLFSGQSMLKMFYTIDKMVSILHAKVKDKEDETGQTFPEVNIEIWGYELCLRKVFEVIINLPDNWNIMNYDPGDWANRYLDILQKLADKGYAYPSPSPREYYRHISEGSFKKGSSLK